MIHECRTCGRQEEIKEPNDRGFKIRISKSYPYQDRDLDITVELLYNGEVISSDSIRIVEGKTYEPNDY